MPKENSTTSKNIASTPEDSILGDNIVKSPALQYGISVGIGVLVIVLVAVTYYLGLMGK
jgi:hypothetical protein